MSTAIKWQNLLLLPAFVRATDLGICGATNGIDICLLSLCATMKIVMVAQREGLLVGLLKVSKEVRCLTFSAFIGVRYLTHLSM